MSKKKCMCHRNYKGILSKRRPFLRHNFNWLWLYNNNTEYVCFMMGHVATGDDHPLYIISSLSIWLLLFDLSLNSGFKLGKLEER